MVPPIALKPKTSTKVAMRFALPWTSPAANLPLVECALIFRETSEPIVVRQDRARPVCATSAMIRTSKTLALPLMQARHGAQPAFPERSFVQRPTRVAISPAYSMRAAMWSVNPRGLYAPMPAYRPVQWNVNKLRECLAASLRQFCGVSAETNSRHAPDIRLAQYAWLATTAHNPLTVAIFEYSRGYSWCLGRLG